MSLTSKLKGAVTVGAVGLAAAGGVREAKGAVYGFTSLQPQTSSVTNGDIFGIDFFQGSWTNVGSGTYNFQIGSGASDTNYLAPTGLINFYNDASKNITNGFYQGRTLDTTLSGISSLGNGAFKVSLSLGGSATPIGKNTNDAFTAYFQAYNPTTNDIFINITELSATLKNPSGGNWGSDASLGKTWALTNSLAGEQGNPNKYSIITIHPSAIPEPGVVGLVALVGAGFLAVRRFRRNGLFAPNSKHSRNTGRRL